jgi:hypothetical protein
MLMQVFNAHFVPNPAHPTGGFDKVLVGNPYPEDEPAPIGWKVAGDGQVPFLSICYIANEQRTQVFTRNVIAAIHM